MNIALARLVSMPMIFLRVFLVLLTNLPERSCKMSLGQAMLLGFIIMLAAEAVALILAVACGTFVWVFRGITKEADNAQQ